eukprot:CAMPEP_0205879262 /NCGR_PEP_ID=MMETSP1083-20121108/15308_1 /ASSEMBLY_ACC=CAM_ASM_000430 /TAXON_ID=97485 /ORGANISM="Prymnesium parvum, Strain Texoma1" /LENGTH=44 /DNA_ID= /DNA_START= /DNA_END= /DNA_ORIENTATION=
MNATSHSSSPPVPTHAELATTGAMYHSCRTVWQSLLFSRHERSS